MRISCNGCRVLRKGCSEKCTIRACLEWINSPDEEANATLFLAKFYGRAGLLHLLHSAPQPLRPAIFRSLLYEACGRIVNPIHGSVGLMWSGNWHRCEAAVNSVLKGLPVTSDTPEPNNSVFPLKLCDIRHVSKDAGPSTFPHHAAGMTRKRFKNDTTSRLKRRTDQRGFDSAPVEENSEASNAQRQELGPLEMRGLDGTREAGLQLTLGWDPPPNTRPEAGERIRHE